LLAVDRYLADERLLMQWTAELGAQFVDPSRRLWFRICDR